MNKRKGFILKWLKPFIHDKPIFVKLTNGDALIIFLLTAISFIIHLWNFQSPSSIIFDEIYFGNFTNSYIHRQFFFDIHPPLAKFLITLFAYLSEYNGNISFSSLYNNEYSNVDYISLRITPIIFSSLIAPIIYLTVRFNSFSKIAAIISSSLILFDTSFLCEGRFILTDAILHFFVSLCICCLSYWLSIDKSNNDGTIMIYLISFALGCSFSVKYTSLSLCFVIGFTQIILIIDHYNYIFDEEVYRQMCIRAIQLFLPSLILHIILWMIHFILIPYSTSYSSQFDIQSFNLLNYSNLSFICDINDAEIQEFIEKYGKNDCLDKSAFIKSPLLIYRFFLTLILIQFSNLMNYQPHSSMTRPKDWPFLTDVWLPFYINGDQQIICIGNIFVYYLSFFGVILVVLYGFIYSFRVFGSTFIPNLPFLRNFSNKMWIKAMKFVVGYFASYLPFFLVPRTLFLYHYLIPLMFASISFGASVDLFCFSPIVKGIFCSISLIVVVFGFFFWSPFVYSTSLSKDERELRIWNSAWINGNNGRSDWVRYMHDQYIKIQRANHY